MTRTLPTDSLSTYRGRFAPTPSGPLHLGSLLTALASWLQARAADGAWLLRVDDLDAPRCPPGADGEILRQLEAHALTWDGAPRYQSDHVDEYVAALERLRSADRLYGCDCTRARLAATSLAGPDGPVYPGTCRARALPPVGQALRLRVGEGTIALDDPWQGPQRRDLSTEVGDFTVRRADGQIGYQLACVVDEQAQGITEVVRGADLLGSSLRQLRLQALLGLPHPSYRHLPVLTDAKGRKLSKQNHAAPIDLRHPGANLARCLEWLGQSLPSEAPRCAPGELLELALTRWSPQQVPRGRAIEVV